MKRKLLARANINGVIRLAIYLKLNINGMSNKQIIKLVAWRLHPNRLFNQNLVY